MICDLVLFVGHALILTITNFWGISKFYCTKEWPVIACMIETSPTQQTTARPPQMNTIMTSLHLHSSSVGLCTVDGSGLGGIYLIKIFLWETQGKISSACRI